MSQYSARISIVLYSMDVPTTPTPTKTYERVDLSAYQQCKKDEKDSDKRQQPFSGKKKTDVSEHIELLTGKDICRQTTICVATKMRFS